MGASRDKERGRHIRRGDAFRGFYWPVREDGCQSSLLHLEISIQGSQLCVDVVAIKQLVKLVDRK